MAGSTDVRRFLRGSVDWDRQEGVTRELLRRYDQPELRVAFLDADNWLSTPCVVNDRWLVKVVTEQNSLLHAVLTTGRNIGAFSSGREGFFEYVADPVEMAERELEATRWMREIGVNVPEPLEAFEYEGLGVLVVEYLPEFRTLNELDAAEVERYAPDLFESLALVHGDLRAENGLVARERLYLVDATSVRDDEDAVGHARACTTSRARSGRSNR